MRADILTPFFGGNKPVYKTAPGPKNFLGLKNALDFMSNNTLDLCTQLTLEYGDIVHAKLGPMQDLMIFSNPKHVRHIFEHSDKKYDKLDTADTINHIAGNSLNTLSLQQGWEEKQALFDQYFQRNPESVQTAAIDEALQHTFCAWDQAAQQQSEVNGTIDMLTLTMSVISRIAFNQDISHFDVAETNDFKYFIVQNVIKRQLKLVTFPIEWEQDTAKALEYRDFLVRSVLETQLQYPSENTYIAALVDKYGIKETNEDAIEQIRGEVLSALFLGSDPFDKLLSRALYFMSLYPSEKDKVIAEIEKKIGFDSEVSFKDLSQLKTLKNFLLETLRLKTPYAVVARGTMEDDVVDGYFIPKGTICVILPLLVHKHKDYWHNPEAFTPSRFEGQNFASMEAYIPFAAGNRACPGRGVVFNQGMYTLVKLLQKYDVNLVANYNYRKKFMGVLSSEDDIRFHISKR